MDGAADGIADLRGQKGGVGGWKKKLRPEGRGGFQ